MASGVVDVELACEESADQSERDVQLSAPVIQLWAGEGAQLTAGEAAALADVLTRAAAELRKIEQAPR